MNHSDTLGENNPLIQAMLKAAGTDDVRNLAEQVDARDAQAEDANFLETPTLISQQLRSSTNRGHGFQPTSSRVGPYVLGKLIGRGGFGRVYEGHHADRPEHKIAVKIFENRWLDGIKRLEIERFVLQKLNHPNLVRALDAGNCEDGVTYLVMNFIDGIRIDQFVLEKGFDYRQIAQLFCQIAEAMEYAHQQDVLHRDLKPGNILTTVDGQPIVTDFGLAKRLNLEDDKSLTATGLLVGTLGYLAPEQADPNRREVTRSVDIYGLGATLYQVIAGCAPFERDNLLKALDELRTHLPVPPTRINSAIPLDLERICLKCLAKSPADRYASMREMATDLQRFIDGKPVAARPLNMRQRFWRWCTANPVISGLSVGLCLALLSGFIASTVFWRQAVVEQEHSAQLLANAKAILEYGDKAAETLLMSTPGSLKYRRERLIKSVQFLDDLVELYPDDDEIYRESATSYFRLGKVCATMGTWEEALEAYETAHTRFLELANAYPDDHTLRFDVFHSLMGLDHIDRDRLGLPSEEEGRLAEAFEIIEELATNHPENMDYLDALICTQTMVYPRRYKLDEPSNNLNRYETMHKEAVRLKTAFPEPSQKWRYVCATAVHIASIHLDSGNFDEAKKWLEIARQAAIEFVNRPDLEPGELLDFAQCIIYLRKLAHEKGDVAQVEELGREWSQYIEKCVADYPDYYVFQDALSQSESILKLDD